MTTANEPNTHSPPQRNTGATNTDAQDTGDASSDATADQTATQQQLAPGESRPRRWQQQIGAQASQQQPPADTQCNQQPQNNKPQGQGDTTAAAAEQAPTEEGDDSQVPALQQAPPEVTNSTETGEMGQELQHGTAATAEATTAAGANPEPQETEGTEEIPPLEESCLTDQRCGGADKPYHEGQGDQRRGNKHTKSEIRAEFKRRGVEKPDHLSWNDAAHMVGMSPFELDKQQAGGTPSQPASSSGEAPPDSKAAAEAKARYQRDKARFAELLNLHNLPRQPPPAGGTPDQRASSSDQPAPGSKADTDAKARHKNRMEQLQKRGAGAGADRGTADKQGTSTPADSTPAAASPHHSQPQTGTTTAKKQAAQQQYRPATHIHAGVPPPVPFPLDSPVTWTTPANYYMASMGGYLPPNPMPPAIPITMESYAHFRYLGHGGWAFCVLSRTSPATPSYQRVRMRGFASVRQQGRRPNDGPLLSMGAQGEVHPLRGGGTSWHLFLRAYPREREPDAAAFSTGHFRLDWDDSSQQSSLLRLDPDDGDLIHRTRRLAFGNPPNMSAHLQEHELQQMAIDPVDGGAIYMLRGRVQFPVEDPYAPRGHRAAALRASLQPGGTPLMMPVDEADGEDALHP